MLNLVDQSRMTKQAMPDPDRKHRSQNTQSNIQIGLVKYWNTAIKGRWVYLWVRPVIQQCTSAITEMMMLNN